VAFCAKALLAELSYDSPAWCLTSATPLVPRPWAHLAEQDETHLAVCDELYVCFRNSRGLVANSPISDQEKVYHSKHKSHIIGHPALQIHAYPIRSMRARLMTVKADLVPDIPPANHGSNPRSDPHFKMFPIVYAMGSLAVVGGGCKRQTVPFQLLPHLLPLFVQLVPFFSKGFQLQLLKLKFIIHLIQLPR
jgi:hypothetical protein